METTYPVKIIKSDLSVARKLVTNSWGLTPERMAWLHQAILRPTINYSCHVWAPYRECPAWLQKELNKVQRLALVAITACTFTTPTRALERLTNVRPLSLHLREKQHRRRQGLVPVLIYQTGMA